MLQKLIDNVFFKFKRKSIAQLLEENWQRIYELEALMAEARRELNMQENGEDKNEEIRV